MNQRVGQEPHDAPALPSQPAAASSPQEAATATPGPPTGIVDLHAHILPGIDDGPADWPAALAMLAQAAQAGTTVMAATSHHMPDGPYRNPASRLAALTQELADRAEEAGLAVTIVPGCELLLSPDVGHRLDAGEIQLLGGQRRYLLCELPMHEVPLYLEAALFDVQLRGITPILAHPERYPELAARPDRLQALVERGVLLQLNSGSLVGRHGEAARQAAHQLVVRRLVHLVASDAHSTGRRSPDQRPGLAALAALLGEPAAHLLAVEVPGRIASGQPVTPDAVQRQLSQLASAAGTLSGRSRHAPAAARTVAGEVSGAAPAPWWRRWWRRRPAG